MKTDLTDFEGAIQASGLKKGMELLNARVPHRFTAIYQLEDSVLKNVVLVDKAGGFDAASLQEVPLSDSFCQFVLRDGSFVTANSGADDRVQGHTYQGVLNSYVGLPLTRDGSALFGTLCHFDFDSHAIADAEFEFLSQVARLLPRFL